MVAHACNIEGRHAFGHNQAHPPSLCNLSVGLNRFAAVCENALRNSHKPDSYARNRIPDTPRAAPIPAPLDPPVNGGKKSPSPLTGRVGEGSGGIERLAEKLPAPCK